VLHDQAELLSTILDETGLIAANIFQSWWQIKQKPKGLWRCQDRERWRGKYYCTVNLPFD
jgi:hypothetical protein